MCIYITGLFIYNSEALELDNLTDILNTVHLVNGSKQVIIVTSKNASYFNSLLQVFEFTDKGWIQPFPSINAVIGRKGFSLDKKEGDQKSPAGVFKIGSAFGTLKAPPQTKLPYKATTYNDYWVDDVNSFDYNKWITYNGNPYDRWQTFEKLKIAPYKYSIIIEYNMNPVVKGKGSAIFFHLWEGSDVGTSGCTAVSEENMLRLLGWLDPSKNPLVIQGSVDMLKTLKQRAMESVIYPIKIIMNEEELNFDVPPRIINGRTLVPLRSVFEKIGAEVLWNEKLRTVNIKCHQKNITLKIDNNIAVVDGVNKIVDVPPKIIKGRTLVPLRFISENLDYNVYWDSTARTINIK